MHSVLLHVASTGLSVVPAPILTRAGRSYVESAERLWELTPWLPGEANFRQGPTRSKLRSAAGSLARFHVAAAQVVKRPSRGPPRSFVERRDLLSELMAGGLERIADAIVTGDWPELAERGRRLVTLFPRAAPGVARDIELLSRVEVPLQPCIRDVRHDHLLFLRDEVSGIVDFGALRADSVALDLAGLLGNLVGDAPEERQLGLAAYEEIRALSTEERSLIGILDAGSVLLSGTNWLRWIYLDHRRFDDRDKVVARLDEIIARLTTLVGRNS
jgi:homoserine kinase type II